MTDYPTNIDPALPTLRDDVDTLRENGMKHIADMIIATQTLVGTGFTDLTSMNRPTGEGGATKFGNLSQMLLALSRIETGEHSATFESSNSGEYAGSPVCTIDFSDSRFTVPPFIFIQTIIGSQMTTAGYRQAKFTAIAVTQKRFSVTTSQRLAGKSTGSGGTPIKFHWLAVQPPFGFVNSDLTEG
mgnify:CR=1 FL=1|tara:strand:- start:1975 stop:2532 length:558 start_codon:yes stop_codon:yes gene_type:complete